jgi:hypothetical protein
MQQILSPEFIKDKEHFEAWRTNRPNQSPIPDRLWKLAVSHIQRYGLNRVSRELRVNYSKLKEKSLELGMDLRKPESIEPSFVELAVAKETLSPRHQPTRLRLVFERMDGSRLSLEGDQPDPTFMEQVIHSFYAR